MRTVRRQLLMVIAIAAVSIGVWPGSGAALASGGPPVKFYIVHDPHYLQTDFLRLVASRTLGDASRYTEIFNLNKGRLQPDGKRLEPGSTIDPGWILELPLDAHGPLVHFGPLPLPGAAAPPALHQHAANSPQPIRSSVHAEAAASAGSGAGFGVFLGGVLAALTIVAGAVTFLITRRSLHPAGRHHMKTDAEL